MIGNKTANIFRSLFERAVAAPDSDFCLFVYKGREQSIGAAEACQRAADYALHLKERDIKRGEIVVILLRHTPDLYFAFIGCMMAGAIPSFMPPLTHKQDPIIFAQSMRTLFERIAPAAVITEPEIASSLADNRFVVIFPQEIKQGKAEFPNIIQALDVTVPQDIAFLQHSSGTTGLKKGVMLSHHAVLAQAETYAQTIGLVPNDVVVSWLPLYHDMGLFTSFVIPVIVGAPIVSIDAMEWVMRPTMLLDAITRHKGAFAWLPNFAFQHIVRLDSGQIRWDFSSLKSLISCSEPCRVGTFERFLDVYGPHGLKPEQLGTSYALAENSFALTQSQIGVKVRSGCTPTASGFLSSGKLLPNAQAEIRPHESQSSQESQVGEIWVKSPSLFEGYFKQSELTNSKLINGWFKTGDLGLVENGELFVVGRVDDLLIINGKNLFAHEIEDIAGAIQGVAPGRVMAHTTYNSETGSTELILLAETPETAETDPKQLSAILRSKIFSFCGVYPKAVHLLPRGFLVKSTSGKIARTASFAKFLSRNS